MQIVIPMSGFGERFRAAGYSVPKPLIEIEGKPIVGHVVDMFPGETDFVFICNQDHLDNPEYRMEEILRELVPTGKIVGIPAHKLGPVWATLQAADVIKRDEPVLVNYCDFTCYWDWQNFKSFVEKSDCTGALPAYRGFHPHTLGTTNYAYMKESNGWMQDIQEKQPWTDNRMEEYASSGAYYFKSGQIMLDAFQATMDKDLSLNGEYYVSLTYKPLLEAGEPIAVYPLQHFMQWGTPQDVAEYNNWSRAFRVLGQPEAKLPGARGSVVVPMAGLGSRFAKEGYTQTKPLIPVSGRSMVTQAVHDLPEANDYAFVLRSDMSGFDEVTEELKSVYPNAIVHVIDEVTEGQAITAEIGLDALVEGAGNIVGPITFGACDNGALYDVAILDALLKDESIDVIVWGNRGNANAVRNPKAMGWIDADESGKVNKISVKVPLDNPETDPAILGTFTFRTPDKFKAAVKRLVDRDGRVNGEFYLDSAINDAIELGMNCVLFEADSYLNWGTPNDLKTFEYWQSCFDKWNAHPYSLDADSRVPSEAVQSMRARYSEFEITVPVREPEIAKGLGR